MASELVHLANGTKHHSPPVKGTKHRSPHAMPQGFPWVMPPMVKFAVMRSAGPSGGSRIFQSAPVSDVRETYRGNIPVSDVTVKAHLGKHPGESTGRTGKIPVRVSSEFPTDPAGACW